MRTLAIGTVLAGVSALGLIGAFAQAKPLAPAQPSLSPTPLAAPGHDHGTEKHKLGRKTIAGYSVSVIYVGEIEAGQHVDFDVKLMDAKADPKALRVWIGAENVPADQKVALAKATTTYKGEVNVPSPLPADWKVWVEVETDAKTERAAYAVEPHDHKH